MGAAAPSRRRLRAELGLLFVGVPVLMTAFFGHYPLLPAVLALGGVALSLLARTPGFAFAELLRPPPRSALWPSALFLIATAAACTAVSLALVPGRFLAIATERTGLWVMIMVFYPLLSALPQELIYRPLFFRRYGTLFRRPQAALAANAVAFGVGHLFYQNPVTILMTMVGGLAFGYAYQRTGSFLLAFFLHAVAGQIVFTAGLGVYFYHGAVGR